MRIFEADSHSFSVENSNLPWKMEVFRRHHVLNDQINFVDVDGTNRSTISGNYPMYPQICTNIANCKAALDVLNRINNYIFFPFSPVPAGPMMTGICFGFAQACKPTAQEKKTCDLPE